MRLKDLIDEASALPVDERALVVESLLKSLNPIEATVDEKWNNGLFLSPRSGSGIE